MLLITFGGQQVAGSNKINKITARYGKINTTIYVQPVINPQKVIGALEKITISHPLKIAYLGKDATAVVSKKSVTRVFRVALHWLGGVFNPQVVSQITFRNTILAPGKTVAVEVAYHSYLVGIYIREAQEDPVLHALHYFSDHPVKINVRYRRHYADEFSVLGL